MYGTPIYNQVPYDYSTNILRRGESHAVADNFFSCVFGTILSHARGFQALEGWLNR